MGSINSLDYPFFEATTYSLDFILSKELTLMMDIYGSVGVSRTFLKSKVKGYTDLEGNACNWRIASGVRKRIFMVLYLSGAVTFSNGNWGGEIGSGIDF